MNYLYLQPIQIVKFKSRNTILAHNNYPNLHHIYQSSNTARMYHIWFGNAFIKVEVQHQFTMHASISMSYKRKVTYKINNCHYMQK